MAELKTKPTESSVEEFLNTVSDTQKRKDCLAILDLMQNITQAEPKMWGGSIVGFGNYHYKYESGREGDWFLTGFSPRKQNIALYIMAGFDSYDELMQKLGKYKTGKACLYIKKIEDINLYVLKELIQRSVKHLSEKYK